MEAIAVKIIYVIIFAIIAGLGANNYFRDEGEIAVLERVVDGDTVYVRIGDEEEKVRMIGIDTPETSDPRKTVECFGQEATNFLKQFEGEEVTLEDDFTQGDTDHYDRSLRYIWLDDTNLNKLMIEEGYAFEHTHDNPYKYQWGFKIAEEIAKLERAGLWDPDTCNGER